MDDQFASRRGVTLWSPFKHRFENLTDEIFLKELKKFVVAIGRHTMGNEQAMPVYGLLRAVLESRLAAIRCGGRKMPDRAAFVRARGGDCTSYACSEEGSGEIYSWSLGERRR
jgi:hypothetical protein